LIADAHMVLDGWKNVDATVLAVIAKDGTRSPSAPFTTSSLQQTASQKL
jgi:DNA topoisomerase IA